jgi:enamine deaminase RidA (YjgF/YER057c/UK114 family)
MYFDSFLLASSFKKIIDAGTSYMHNRGYSRSIRVDGAYSTIYLAGVTSTRDLYTNRSLVGDFDGQVRDVYARINQTLVEQFCGELHDLVATTAFITNGSFGTRFAELRKEIFNERDFPTSALIIIVSLAKQEMMVEVQSVAVIPSRNKEQNIRSNSFVIFTCFFFILPRFF